MNTFKFDLNSIEEMYSYGLFEPVDSIFQFMYKQIKKDNIIILEKKAVDNGNCTLEVFDDVDNLNKFYHKFMNNHKISFLTLYELNK